MSWYTKSWITHGNTVQPFLIRPNMKHILEYRMSKSGMGHESKIRLTKTLAENDKTL